MLSSGEYVRLVNSGLCTVGATLAIGYPPLRNSDQLCALVRSGLRAVVATSAAYANINYMN